MYVQWSGGFSSLDVEEDDEDAGVSYIYIDI